MRRVSLVLISALFAIPVALAAPPAMPGRLILPDFSALAKKATRVVDLSLDPSELQTAASFLNSGHDADAHGVNRVVSGMRGLYVRSYHFAHAGEYSRADVRRVLAQLAAPGWKPILSVRNRKAGQGSTDVNISVLRVGGQTEGMAIVAAKPRELTIVNIVGSIDLSKLAQIQGQFGVPPVGVAPPQNAAPAQNAAAPQNAAPPQNAAAPPNSAP